MITNSILAGALIGIGDIALMSCDNKYIGALLFAVALMSIIYFQLPLFTGRVGRVVRDRSYIYCFFVLFFNVIGTAISVWGYTLMSPENRQKVIAVADQKFGRGLVALFVAGVFCNVLIHLAVSSKHSILVVICVMAFILCGFEHSIADAGYAFVSGDWRNMLTWLIVVAGNTVGAILTFYFLHEEEEEVEDGKSGE